MDILKEIDDNSSVLLIIEGMNYNEEAAKITRDLSKKKVCFITLNKTYPAMKELLEKKGINTGNITWIDAISKTMKNVPDKEDNCYYISSPGALTEIAITISKLQKENFDYIILDAINNLVVYRDKKTVAKFLIDFVSKIEDTNTKIIFYAFSTKEQEDLLKECGTFMDKTVSVK